FYTTPLPLCMLFSFFFSSSAARRALHSFPTRRSSDLRYHAGADGSDAFNAPIAAKIGEITLPHWRNGLAFADAHQLLPRSYLWGDRKSTRLNSSHVKISYAVFCLKKKITNKEARLTCR